MNSDIIRMLDKQYVMGTYARFDLVVDHGRGAKLWDADGKEYIDLAAGIGVSSLGYADPLWLAAVVGQATKFAHISNLYYHEPGTRLAQKLCDMSGLSKVIFCNSGAESNEIAIKLARKKSYDEHGLGRAKIVTLQNSFHGRTITTLAATGQEVFHRFFFPFTEGFAYAQPGDLEALRQIVENDPSVCAVMVEVIQGEGGVMPMTRDYLKGVETLCHKHSLALICDEVQSGIGRCGTLFAYEQFGIHPDIVSTAKGLGGGLPIGAVLAAESYASVFGPSDHGTTFGANPIATAAGCVVVDRLCEPDFLEAVRRKGQHIRERLGANPKVKEVRGLGLMLGVVLDSIPGKAFAEAALQNGLVVLTAKDAVRLLPPLVITDEELEEALDRFEKTLEGCQVNAVQPQA